MAKAKATKKKEVTEIPFSEDIQTLFTATMATAEELKGGTVKPNTEDALFIHAGYKGIEKAAKAGIDAVRPILQKAAEDTEGGTFEGANGKATYTWIQGDDTVNFTEATTELLEQKGVLDDSVVIHATLKPGVEVEKITEKELEVIQKYFDVEYTLSHEKIAAQVTLEKLTQEELDATVERVPAKGYGRLNVTPAKEVKKAFS